MLVHGIGMSHRYFDGLARELPAHLDVRSVDLPGFGGTARPPKQWEVGDYADHLTRHLEATGLPQTILVGHSMGAQFVTEAAVRRPDLVAGVVLIGPVSEAGRRTVSQHVVALAADVAIERPSSNVLVFADYIRTGLPWYFTELPVMLRYRIEDRMPELQMPVMVMRGERDAVSRNGWCRDLAALAVDGEFVEVPGQPHAVQRSAPADVAASIVDFASRSIARA